MSEHDPRDRISYAGDLEPVFDRALDAYGLGDLSKYETVNAGYEDLNVLLQTNRGKFFAKVFSVERTHEQIVRFEEIMTAVMNGGVAHPKLHTVGNDLVFFDASSALYMVVMDFVEGQTFYEMGRLPDDDELQEILRQTALINQVQIKPALLYDSWALPNLRRVLDPIKEKIPDDDRALIEKAVTGLETVVVADLPHCFVHGDIIKSNVMKAADGKICIVDFSVSNWYPRVQELAVITANLLNDFYITESYTETVARVSELYQQVGGELTTAEIEVLPIFARAAYASELLGSLNEALKSDNPPSENEYWLKLGRAGLLRATKDV